MIVMYDYNVHAIRRHYESSKHDGQTGSVPLRQIPVPDFNLTIFLILTLFAETRIAKFHFGERGLSEIGRWEDTARPSSTKY